MKCLNCNKKRVIVNIEETMCKTCNNQAMDLAIKRGRIKALSNEAEQKYFEDINYQDVLDYLSLKEQKEWKKLMKEVNGF